MATPHSQATIDAAYDNLCAIAQSARTAQEKCLHQPFKDALSTYSIATNQSLSTTIQSKLPRELRDIIYTHYWHSLCGNIWSTHPSDPDPIMLRRQRPWTKPCPQRGTPIPCQCNLSWETNPHLILPSFVGATTAQEAAIAAYKVFNSNWYSGPEPEELRLYLEVDWYHLDLVPGDYYTWLHIYIFSPNPDTSLLNLPSPKPDKPPIPMFSALGRGILLDNFSALRELKNKARLQVKIQLDEMRLSEVEQFLKVIRPVWRDLTTSGAKVEIQGDAPPKAFRELGPWRDLSGFYGMGREEWRREMGAFIS